MRLIHTADLHLNQEEDERWQALEEILDRTGDEQADLLIISGDLFDSVNAAEKLRPAISGLFSGRSFLTLIIPGNHDREAFSRGYYFGEDVHVFHTLEEPLEKNGARIWGLPFMDLEGVELLRRLQTIPPREDHSWQLLLFHGELIDAFFRRDDFGQEGESRYLPVKLSYFASLDLDYVLAGHFHSQFRLWDIPGGGQFIYSGSPVAITRRETGPRRVTLLEKGEKPVPLELNTPYFAPVLINLNPLEEADPVTRVENELKKLPPQARPLLEVRGYVDSSRTDKSETRVIQELKKASDDFNLLHPPDIEVRDVSWILQEDLFQAFREKLEQVDYPDRQELLEMALKARLEVKG